MTNKKFIIFAVLAGVLYFLTFNCAYILIPTNYEWMARGTDSAQHYIGWAYFRHTPLIQYPIGLNPNFGMVPTNTIVFSDSIPLLAILFKLFNPILPEYFQYFGWWALLCFILQVYFAMKLLSTRIDNKYIIYIGSLFFLFTNSFILYLRIAGGQFALLSQWIVLAALYFAMDKRFSLFRWGILIILASLIHAYLTGMVITIFFADFINRCYKKEIHLSSQWPKVMAVFVLLFAVMHAVGYFAALGTEMLVHVDYTSHIFGLIDPNGSTHLSTIMPTAKNFVPVYIGTGIIILYIYLLISRSSWKEFSTIPIALLIACFLMYVYSWGPNIGISHGTILFSLPDIPIYRKLVSFFRTTNRFAWPLMYMAIFIPLYILSTKKMSNRSIIIVLVTLLSLQFLDHMRDHKSSRRQLEAKRATVSSYVDIPEINNISFLTCEYTTHYDFAFNSYFAAHNVPNECIDRARLHTDRTKFNKDTYENGQYDKSAAYVLRSDELIAEIESKEPKKVISIGGAKIFIPQK